MIELGADAFNVGAGFKTSTIVPVAGQEALVRYSELSAPSRKLVFSLDRLAHVGVQQRVGAGGRTRDARVREQNPATENISCLAICRQCGSQAILSVGVGVAGILRRRVELLPGEWPRLAFLFEPAALAADVQRVPVVWEPVQRSRVDYAVAQQSAPLDRASAGPSPGTAGPFRA